MTRINSDNSVNFKGFFHKRTLQRYLEKTFPNTKQAVTAQGNAYEQVNNKSHPILNGVLGAVAGALVSYVAINAKNYQKSGAKWGLIGLGTACGAGLSLAIDRLYNWNCNRINSKLAHEADAKAAGWATATAFLIPNS